MPMKELLHRLQPIQVYIVLALSVCYFLVQFYISQTSQSITLLVQTYHMLCNIIALSGCIISIKGDSSRNKRSSVSSNESIEELKEDVKQKEIVNKHMSEKKKQNRENSLKNTFGWARVDVLTMIIVCVFLTSLCFSVVVEVIQTLFHVGHHDHLDHKDEYHSYTYEICIILGALGLVLNGISYLLIGGYTFHQGSFLHLTEDGTVFVLERNISEKRQVSTEEKLKRKSQRIHELSRDVCSSVMVIICSIVIVVCNDKESFETQFIDPFFAILSIVLLLTLSYPYMKEAGMILLQTIPNTIDIKELHNKILAKFPQIDSLHDFHIWQLTHAKFVATVHMIFHDPSVFNECINDIINFFHEHDINIVTIQPEFKTLDCIEQGFSESKLSTEEESALCLVACRQITCEEKLCCQRRSSTCSSESLSNKSKGNSQVLEQVISIRNVSGEELNIVNQEFTSIKTLSGISEDSTDFAETSKRLSSSLSIPQRYRKIQKTVSVSDRNNHDLPANSDSRDIHLVSFKRVVSESMIKSDEHDEMGRKPSEIFVENRLLSQVHTTDNNETEDLYTKTECDSK
ncbi:hypothetical protein ACKWTF_010891 [Chironomus riparius]